MNIVYPVVLCSELPHQFLEEYTESPKHVKQHLSIKLHLPGAYIIHDEIRKKRQNQKKRASNA